MEDSLNLEDVIKVRFCLLLNTKSKTVVLLTYNETLQNLQMLKHLNGSISVKWNQRDALFFQFIEN
jgi:hypothetical protein